MRLIDAEQMEKHIMESKVFTQYFKELVQSLIWGENTVDVAPVVRGRWERMISPYGELEGFICACGRTSQSADNYCPNCGAKMEDKPCG